MGDEGVSFHVETTAQGFRGPGPGRETEPQRCQFALGSLEGSRWLPGYTYHQQGPTSCSVLVRTTVVRWSWLEMVVPGLASAYHCQVC